MEELAKQLEELAKSGRRYGRNGLLIEAAYRYGQASAVIQAMYTLHENRTIELSREYQAYLAQMHEKLSILAESPTRSAGNGRHKMSGKREDARAREGLLNVLALLCEDLAL